MIRLYLVRHGTAVPSGTPGLADDARPLTPEGEREVSKIAEGLARLGIDPGTIATSPLPRARRTAEILAEGLSLSGRLEDAEILRPGSAPDSMRQWLSSRKDESLMLVGHNPSLTDLLGMLLGFRDVPPFDLKKAGIAALRSEERGRYELQWLATPKLIRRLME
jgi:phosphohistidine phosphatase